MPFIIWGTRGLTSQKEQGAFFCPNCNEECDYRLMEVRPYFTLFFIPIFPTGAGQRYVECAQCNQQYLERVLEMEMPSAEERFIGQFYNELATGSSVEMVRKKIEAAGVAADRFQALHARQLGLAKTTRCEIGKAI